MKNREDELNQIDAFLKTKDCKVEREENSSVPKADFNPWTRLKSKDNEKVCN